MFAKCPIPGHENDKIIISSRRHIVSLLRTILVIILMMLVPVFIIVAVNKLSPGFFSGIFLNFAVVIGSIYYLITFVFILMQWISYYYDIFIVTDREVLDINQNGLFDRKITEISILRIQDVSARVHGIFATIFNYGSVVAESAGENSRTYIIEDIPNPIAVANKILELHNEHIAREERADEVIIGEGDFRSKWPAKPCPPCPPCPPNENKSSFAAESPFEENESLPPTDTALLADNPTLEKRVDDNLSKIPNVIASENGERINLLSEQNKTQSSRQDQGNFSQEDLNKGGEIKF